MAPTPMHYAPGMTGQDLYGLITVCGLESRHLYECRARVRAGIAGPGRGLRR